MHPRQIPVLLARHRWTGLSRAGGGCSVTGSRAGRPPKPAWVQPALCSRADTFGVIWIWSPGALLTIDGDTRSYSQFWPSLPIPRYEGHVGDNCLPLERDRLQNAVTHTVCPGRACGNTCPTRPELILETSIQQQSYTGCWEGVGLTPEAPIPILLPAMQLKAHRSCRRREPCVPKPPGQGWPAGRGASSERGHRLCSSCAAEREEADGRRPRNSSPFCSFMTNDKQGSKSPSGSPSSSLFIRCSSQESANSQKPRRQPRPRIQPGLKAAPVTRNISKTQN